MCVCVCLCVFVCVSRRFLLNIVMQLTAAQVHKTPQRHDCDAE